MEVSPMETKVRTRGIDLAPVRASLEGSRDRGLAIARILSGIGALLLAAGAAAGVFVEGVYRDPEAVAAMFRGYDVIALVIIAPALAVTLLPTFRGSIRAQLVWLGLLAYSVYHSAMYVFGTTFNSIFLVHVGMFSAFVFAFGSALASVDVRAIAARFSQRTPVRLVGGILLFLGAALAVFWSAPSLMFAFGGEVPSEGSKLIVPASITHLGWVLDLSLLVPAYVTAGILLWRRAPWGYTLATAVLIAGVLQQIEYGTALVFQANADIPGASAFDPIEPLIIVAYLIGAVVLLAHVRRAGPGG
jgi:hypothetical protein